MTNLSTPEAPYGENENNGSDKLLAIHKEEETLDVYMKTELHKHCCGKDDIPCTLLLLLIVG
jgi:hypothetical protein